MYRRLELHSVFTPWFCMPTVFASKEPHRIQMLSGGGGGDKPVAGGGGGLGALPGTYGGAGGAKGGTGGGEGEMSHRLGQSGQSVLPPGTNTRVSGAKLRA